MRMLRWWSDMPVVLRVLAIFASVYVYRRLPTGVADIYLAALVIAAVLAVRAAGQVKRMREAIATSRQTAGPSVAMPTPDSPPWQRRTPDFVAMSAASRRHFKWGAVRSNRAKPTRDKVYELTGAMLLAFFVVAALTIVTVVLRGEVPAPEQLTWLLLTTTAGAWLVLAANKVWEGRRGDSLVRRFVLMMLGLAWGAGAWALDRLLWVNLPYEILSGAPPRDRLGLQLYDLDGQPELLAYLGYFGFLMFAVRWWLQMMPTRESRVSIWSTVLTVATAALLSLLWPFPQPWGIAVAGIMSLAVQFASPNLSVDR
jgi:hypothetical protein